MSDENVSTSASTTVSKEEKKMSAPTSKNPFVLMTSNPTAGVAMMAGLPVLTLVLSYFLFKSTPAEKKAETKDDKNAAAQVAPAAPAPQPQQLAYYQPPAQYAQPIQSVPQFQPAGLLPMTPAAQGTASFVVASAGKNSRGWVFLNDTPDYKIATRTIVIKNPAILGQWAAEPQMIKGRVVTATGTQTSYNGKPQIDAASVQIQ